MNTLYDFNAETPDAASRRMKLATALQSMEQPAYQRYKGPMGAPNASGGLSPEMMKLLMGANTQKPAPVEEKSRQYVPDYVGGFSQGPSYG